MCLNSSIIKGIQSVNYNMFSSLTFTAVLKCSQQKFLPPDFRISNNAAAQKHHEKNNETWPKQTTESGSSPFPRYQLPFGSWQCKNLKIVCKLKAKCELILIKHMRHSQRTLSWCWQDSRGTLVESPHCLPIILALSWETS